MTIEEIRLYESHPSRGCDILSQLQSVPTDILHIVLQHHENCQGLGFPEKLSRARIHPMARLVAVADEFCSLALNGPERAGLSPRDAIQRMYTLHSKKFDPQFLVALMRSFKMTPPEELLNAIH